MVENVITHACAPLKIIIELKITINEAEDHFDSDDNDKITTMEVYCSHQTSRE